MSPGRMLSSSISSSTTRESSTKESPKDVVVVGAGPAGLMLAANLVRFGIDVQILDDRADKTSTGRADGLQPKTIETLRQMRLAGPVLEKGVRIHDICFWSSSPSSSMRRTGREIHYPPMVDVLEPYILLVHQGMVENLFIDDMKTRGAEVSRNSPFISYELEMEHGSKSDALVIAQYEDIVAGDKKSIATRFLVGTDGAHSKVRKSMPGVEAIGGGSEAIWGVLDGAIETQFPDLWSKVVVHSEEYGSVLCIPRERNMTRLYIELRSEAGEPVAKAQLTQEFVMERANQILSPFVLQWTSVEWFGIYKIGQRVASHFTNSDNNVFIAGDASHTHSPKAAQGMNTSIHDSHNLAWKLNLSVRNLAKPTLLATYEHERRKIAQDLISFDFEHANAFAAGDAEALAENFKTNILFISGVGVRYAANCLNVVDADTEEQRQRGGLAKAGSILPPVKATRYIDANPVDVQLDIPMLGQFRVYFIIPDILKSRDFLNSVCEHISNPDSLLSRVTSAAKKSLELQRPVATEADEYVQPGRYTAASPLFTYALMTQTPKNEMEIADLPALMRASRWTFYLDGLAPQSTGEASCAEKWLGELADGEVAIVNVRPDGYVGSLKTWKSESKESGEIAGAWLEAYYGGFLLA